MESVSDMVAAAVMEHQDDGQEAEDGDEGPATEGQGAEQFSHEDDTDEDDSDESWSSSSEETEEEEASSSAPGWTIIRLVFEEEKRLRLTNRLHLACFLNPNSKFWCHFGAALASARPCPGPVASPADGATVGAGAARSSESRLPLENATICQLAS